MSEEKFLFTITYLQCSETGHYWSKETDTHTVKIIASTVTEAIEKMEKVTGVKHYKNLCWDCEEILDKVKE